MKIAFTCPYDMSRSGGVKEIVEHITSKLEKRGIKTKILTLPPAKKIKIKNGIYFAKSMHLKISDFIVDIDIENILKNSKMRKYLEKEKFDLICLQEPAHPFLNWEVLANTKIKKIGWFHSTTFFDLDSFPINIVTLPFEKWLAKNLDGLIAASPTVVKTWNKVFNGRERLILPAGTDVKKFLTSKKIDLGPQANILFVGRLDKMKGVLDGLRAFKKVLEQVNSKLWIIGTGPQAEKAKKLAIKLGVIKKVEFLGFLPDTDLAKYYRSADIFLAPAVGKESVGLVLLEAMSAGIPVVGYKNAGYKFTMTGNPWDKALVEVGDYKSLSSSVLEILNSSKLRREVVSWQTKRVKEFDWEVVTDKFVAYFEKILAVKPTYENNKI